MADRTDLAQVSARAVAPILLGIREAGMDPGPVLAEVGFDPGVLVDPDARVQHDRVVMLWERATALTGDPDFGLRCAGLLAPGQLGVIEYAFRKSDSLRQGLERVQRYFRLNHDVAGFEFNVKGGRFQVRHTLPAARTLPRAAVDFILANPVRIAREATSGGVSPCRVLLDYPRPLQTALLEECFQCELVFSASCRAFEYPELSVHTPLLEADPALSVVLEQHAQMMLDRIPQVHSFSDRVRELIASQLCAGNIDAQGTAEKLRMSVRTLHRRLSDEGTSHNGLLEQLRRDLSERFLRQATMSISEAAFMLGFSEPSAFHRAFKRWNGCTPAQFRQRLG